MQERGPVAPLIRGRGVTIGGVAIGVVALDQLTKTWAEHALADGPIHLFWTLRLTLTYNSGASFSIGPGLTPFITALGVVLLILLVGMSRSTATMLGVVAMGMVIGGASGNLVDRLVRGNNGAVIDFIDFQWWPVFNVADIALVIGAGLLLFSQRKRT